MLSAIACFFIPGSVLAQIPDTAAARREAQQRLGRPVTQGEIVDRLRDSGMTRSQMRARLQQAGYDPGLADRYYDVLERGAEPPEGAPAASFVEALSRVGLARRITTGNPVLERELMLPPDSVLPPDPDTLGPRDREVFGVRTFRRASSQFDPSLFGPVDAGYRLGPGDELTLILTGDVEDAIELPVSREGLIFIPAAGQISVNGLTLAQLEDLLYSRLGRVYSGISRSANASTRFQISVGRLRANLIRVTGDVLRPGAYQVTSVGGLFDALYQAGGPTTGGSFRRIEVHRGGRLVHVADLYDFLVRGDATSDMRLESNDRVFVPPAQTQARVEGAVRRPMVYEMKEGEGLRELLMFAGGLRADALAGNIKIDRILPPSERRPGVYRTLMDAEDIGSAHTPILDGDVVTVSEVPDIRRNRIWVEGEVRNPALYEFTPGATLWSMIEKADGLNELAYLSRAHIYRYVDADGTRRLIPVTLERNAAGQPLSNDVLQDNDSIVVYSRATLRTQEFVTIDGYVKEPNRYPLARGMTLRDLILTAEGFSHGAFVLEAEVSRLPDPLTRTDTTAVVITVPLTGTGLNPDGTADVLPRWLPEAGDFPLQHGDFVFIRQAPGYQPSREIRITGEVLVPGRYVLATREERIADVITRAGGLTPQAYAPGMHVIRGGQIIAADLQRGIRNPADANNIMLQAGDSVHVPEYDPTVGVAGAVNFAARVLYVPGKSLEYYISQAGGYTDQADRNRTTVAYPNGERAAVSADWIVRRSPRVQPGSQIFVPAKPDGGSGVDWDQIVVRGTAVLTAVATVMLAISQLR